MHVAVPAVLRPPAPRGDVEAPALLVTHVASVLSGIGSLVAYFVLRAVGVSPHPAYLYAVAGCVLTFVLLRTRFQVAGIYGFVIAMVAVIAWAAYRDRSIAQPSLPVLLLALAYGALAWRPIVTAVAVAAELAIVVWIFHIDVSNGTSAAVGIDPRRELAVLILAILSGGALFSIVARAVHRARRTAEEEARRARREIRRREETEARLARHARLEALGRLTGGIAHDFNNLMTAVASNLESLRPVLERKGAEDEIAERIEAALQAVGRGARLTRQLLSYTRKQTFHVASVDVATLLDSMLPLVRRAAGESVIVAVTVEPNLFPCKADPAQLEAAILNLVINAHDAMPGGGDLEIDVRSAVVGPADAGGRLAPGAYVAVTVSDTGCGMEPEVLERATEPFFTTKKDGQGTGLGLAMVQGFLQRVGGTLVLDSEPGKGTRATIYLPRAEGLALSDDHPEGSGARPSFGRGKLVLVVEDDPDVREASVALFEALGFRPLPAANGRAALELLERYEPALLFTDVVLPGGLDGVAVARRARERYPNLAVLLTSGYTGDDVSAVRDFPILHKPFRAKELRAKLRALMPDLAA